VGLSRNLRSQGRGLKAPLSFFLSLLIGAFIASVAAALGGHVRDEHERLYSVERICG
jgi:hypothetical protein